MKKTKKTASHGGARPKAGRKPVKDKKVQVSLYIKQSRIKEFGGVENLKKEIFKRLQFSDH